MKAKEFLGKYKVHLAIGVAVATLIIIIAVKSRKKGSSKGKNLKKLADEDKRKWEGRKETDKEVSDTLVGYWKTVGYNYSPSQMQSASWQKGNPWSASYVTHLVKNSGYNFKGGATHSSYAVQGKSDRNKNEKDKYWAFRPSENKPVEVGDILVKNRDGGNYNYDTIKSGVKSHGDVIIDIQNEGGKKIAYFQGGNLSNSIGRGKINLDNNGLLPNDSPYFLQLKYIEK